MERHPTVVIYAANRVGSCVDEELDYPPCHTFIAACIVERRPTTLVSSTGIRREIFDEVPNYSLIDSFIAAASRKN